MARMVISLALSRPSTRVSFRAGARAGPGCGLLLARATTTVWTREGQTCTPGGSRASGWLAWRAWVTPLRSVRLALSLGLFRATCIFLFPHLGERGRDLKRPLLPAPYLTVFLFDSSVFTSYFANIPHCLLFSFYLAKLLRELGPQQGQRTCLRHVKAGTDKVEGSSTDSGELTARSGCQACIPTDRSQCH